MSAKGRLIRKPRPISPNYRIIYKVSLVVLILKICCTGEKGSIGKINYIMNLIKNIDLDNEGLGVADMDMATNRAIILMAINGLVVFQKGKIKITTKGEEIYRDIIDNNVFIEEVTYLKELGKRAVLEKDFQ